MKYKYGYRDTVTYVVIYIALIFFPIFSKAQVIRLEVQAAHSDTINYLSKSFDGRYLITSGDDGLTKIWDKSGKVILSVEGYQNTKWHYGNNINKYSSLNGGSAVKNNQLIVADGNSGFVRLIDIKTKNVIKVFTTDSVLSYARSRMKRTGFSNEEISRKLESSSSRVKAFFANGINNGAIVIERQLSFRNMRDKAINITEIWNRSGDKIIGTFSGTNPVFSESGDWFALAGYQHGGKEKDGINVYKLNLNIDHYKTIEIKGYPIQITPTKLVCYEQGSYVAKGIAVSDLDNYSSKVYVAPLLNGAIQVISDKIFSNDIEKTVEESIKDKWNKNYGANSQLIKRAKFSKKEEEILITSSKTTTVINFRTGQITELYQHPKDTSTVDLFIPIKTNDSIIFKVSHFGESPFVTSDFRVAILPRWWGNDPSSQRIFNINKNKPAEYPGGQDSLYVFKFSPDGMWRAEVRYLNPLKLEQLRGNGYSKSNPVLTSLYFKNKLAFQTDSYCEVNFSSDNKWVRWKEPEKGVSITFPLGDFPDRFYFLPIMNVTKQKKLIQSDTTVLRFLFNSYTFSAAYSDDGYYSISDDDFSQYRYALSETLIKNKANWDVVAKDTVGLNFESPWISSGFPIAEPQEIGAFSNFFIDLLDEEKPDWIKFSQNGQFCLTLSEAKENEFIHATRREGVFNAEDVKLTLKLHDSWKRTSKVIEKTKQEFPITALKFSVDGALTYYTIQNELTILNTIDLSDYYKISLETEIQSVDISADNSKVLVATKSEISVWDLKSKIKLLSFQLTDDGNLLTSHPSGLFDASQKLINNIHFVQDGTDVIALSQLKSRYYEPGLWKKVFSSEKLRDVLGFKGIDLPPDIRVGKVDKKGYLPIELINKGGGIGEVTLYVNGKEVIKDVRKANTNPDTTFLSISVYVANQSGILKGQENLLALKAWNKDHWVVSRGEIVSYKTDDIETYKPAIHILTCGVSDYTGDELDLKYAAKDAEDVNKALQLGAKQLFGLDKSYLYTLTTNQPKDQYPTKENILKTIDKIASTAHPLDVFVMYISGHGINYGGAEGDWYYLTQDAYTSSSSAYSDPAIRLKTTLSSNELVELFKKVPALKQVLIIDACASGRVVETLIESRDISATTLRALDRMRDRTGLHIITGCTADAVSYEASKYGQGVLTYSLLEGIRGASLRENQYIDINNLFQYAQDRVPVLATGIGGIQTPQVFSPQGSQSFDIGLLDEEAKRAVPLASIRPVYIRSNFQDDHELEDVLNLGKQVDEALNDVSSKGIDATLIFVDVRDYPNGCKLIGRYTQSKGTIKLRLRKKCSDKDESINLTGKTIEELKAKILKVL